MLGIRSQHSEFCLHPQNLLRVHRWDGSVELEVEVSLVDGADVDGDADVGS